MRNLLIVISFIFKVTSAIHMALHTIGKPSGPMGPLPFSDQVANDVIVQQLGSASQAAVKAMAITTRMCPGRKKHELSMWVTPCADGNLGQHPAMFRVTTPAGLPLVDGFPVKLSSFL